jgi:hypothetical protein
MATLNGRVSSLQGSTLTLQPGPGVPFDSRNITISAATNLLRDKQRITSADLRIGDEVEIQVVVSSDRVEAISIHTPLTQKAIQ